MRTISKVVLGAGVLLGALYAHHEATKPLADRIEAGDEVLSIFPIASEGIPSGAFLILVATIVRTPGDESKFSGLLVGFATPDPLNPGQRTRTTLIGSVIDLPRASVIEIRRKGKIVS